MINKEFAHMAKCTHYSCKFRKFLQKYVVYLKHIIVYLVHTPKKMQKTLFFVVIRCFQTMNRPCERHIFLVMEDNMEEKHGVAHWKEIHIVVVIHAHR